MAFITLQSIYRSPLELPRFPPPMAAAAAAAAAAGSNSAGAGTGGVLFPYLMSNSRSFHNHWWQNMKGTKCFFKKLEKKVGL